MFPENKSIPLSQLPIGPNGFEKPLCTNCVNFDCEHKIEKIDISILGINESHRVIFKRNIPQSVVYCEGLALGEGDANL